MTSRFEILKDLFWCGEIGDVEFFELAFEAGMSTVEIGEFLAEVREHDEVEL